MIGVVEWQIISKILTTKDISILDDNCITDEYFAGGEYEAEYRFIKDHYKQYGNVPDIDTFITKFRDFEVLDVTESDEFLVDTIREEFQFKKAAPIIDKIADLANEDANKACEFMLQSIKDLQPNYRLGGVDIIANAKKRLEAYKERKEHQDDWYFTTGFPELDRIIHGFLRGEEFVVLFARLGMGKSWVLAKMTTHIWRQGFNVCYISPEMSDDSVGYRFDTLLSGFSNSALMWGNDDIDIEEYEKHIQELSTHPNKFIVATPLDFDNKITVSKLITYVKQNKIEFLAIDGIKYLTDERARRGDKENVSLTNISEDLMSLSMELSIPIVVVSQANRGGVVDKESDGIPEVENISSSDGIGQCATKIIALRQKDGYLELCVKKQRFGPMGTRLKYLWNINTGEFTYTSGDDEMPAEGRAERRERKKNIGKDVF